MILGLLGLEGPWGEGLRRSFTALILAVEKWLTIHHCRRFIREFIPKD